LIRALGVGHLLIIPFDKDFAQTEAEDFVVQLTENARGLGEICVGHEWSFGKNRAGNLALLRKLGTRHHFNVVGIPPVKVNGAVVSSTAIRARIERGDFAGAAVMLGRDYTILGTVREGSKLGRQIGFPTANLSAHSEQFPPNGVYFVEAWFEGVLHHGVVNVGFRPTVSGEKAERTIEVHLLDFHRDIYGGDIEIKFVQFLRPEKKFENVEALAKLGYDISDHLGAYFDASYEKVFSAHTPTTYSYISNNQSYLQSDWRGGAELDVASITAGLKGNF